MTLRQTNRQISNSNVVAPYPWRLAKRFLALALPACLGMVWTTSWSKVHAADEVLASPALQIADHGSAAAPESRPVPPAQPREFADRGPDRGRRDDDDRDQPRRRGRRGWDRHDDRGSSDGVRRDDDRRSARDEDADRREPSREPRLGRERRFGGRDFRGEWAGRGPMWPGFGGWGRGPFFGPPDFDRRDARFAERGGPERWWARRFDGGPGMPGPWGRGGDSGSQAETNRLLRDLTREIDELRGEIRALREQRAAAPRGDGRSPGFGGARGGFAPFGGFGGFRDFGGFGGPGPRGPRFEAPPDGRRRPDGPPRRGPEGGAPGREPEDKRPVESSDRQSAENPPHATHAA